MQRRTSNITANARGIFRAGRLAALLIMAWPLALPAGDFQVIGWNEFGIDTLDSDYSVFSIWPPGNTIRAQVIYQRRRLTNANNITVTYQAIADPDGSINSTSQGKTEFWSYAPALYGTNLAVDRGLSGFAMPGTNNVPQAMAFNTTSAWFSALDVPIIPKDDAGLRKFYPLMRLVARTNNAAFATNDIVMPISDEVDCRVCHASGAAAAAQPVNGWAWNTNPERDYRLNILRRHDDLKDQATYPGILSSNGYNPAGLYRTVVADGVPVRCTQCHKSTIVTGSGFGTIKPLTAAIHTHHASVVNPDTGAALDNVLNRATCYHCHPGVTTKALRGVMGDSVSTSGTKHIQCQSCHGQMSAIGASNRVGYIDVPDCQSCHTGTATSNNGEIRYTSAFLPNGTVRQAVNQTFATRTNLAFGNYSLYRYSTNHAKLFCAACHGSPHAEFTADRNDNIRVRQVQGHDGMLSDCTSCHTTPPASGLGPHGAHQFGQTWVSGHRGSSGAACNACHGADERGSILSLAQKDETLTSTFGNKPLWRGFRVSCYMCHSGSGDLSPGPAAPGVVNVSTNTSSDAPVTMRLPAVDGNSPALTLTLRIISQPARGTVGITNTSSTNWFATYYPDPGFVGTERFTYAAWNDATDSNLGTGTVAVAQGPFSISTTALVPPTFPAVWAAPFRVITRLVNIETNVVIDWDFGDGAHGTNQNGEHAYALPGSYTWKVVSTVQGAPAVSATNSGSIIITPAIGLSAAQAGGVVTLSWPQIPEALLEQTPVLGEGAIWTIQPAIPQLSAGRYSVSVPNEGIRFFRLRKL